LNSCTSRGRTVLITVAKVDDKTLRVNVIPHGKATTTQLSVHHSPIPARPRTHTELGKHLRLRPNPPANRQHLAEAKATMEAAAKAAQEEAKRKKATQKPPDRNAANAAEPASTASSASQFPLRQHPLTHRREHLPVPSTTPNPLQLNHKESRTLMEGKFSPEVLNLMDEASRSDPRSRSRTSEPCTHISILNRHGRNHGPEAVGDKLRYQFTRAIGSKG